MITTNGATLEPIEEFKKFTASFATPTMMSKTAKINSATTAINNISIPIIDILSNQHRSVNISRHSNVWIVSFLFLNNLLDFLVNQPSRG